MHSPIEAPPVPEDILEAGYETRDFNPAPIYIFTAVVGFTTAMAVVICLIILRAMDQGEASTAPPVSPLAATVMPSTTPDMPYLQQRPVAEKEQIIGTAQAHVARYGIVSDDPAMTIAHIPVERAMELLADGAVPYRQEPTVALESAVEEAE